MQISTRKDAAGRSWQAFLAAIFAVCVAFGLMGVAGAALAAPESSSSSASAASSSSSAADDDAAFEQAVQEAAELGAIDGDVAGIPFGDDLFKGAESIDSTGEEILANLFAAARTVELKQTTVGSDAFVAGDTINIAGMKSDNNIFVAGNNITVSGTEGDTLFIVGNNLDIAADAVNAYAAGRTVFLKGTFEGNVHVNAQSVVIDPYIVVNGSLYVEAVQEPTIASTAKIGSFDFNQAEYDDGLNIASGFANIGSPAWIEDLVKTLIALLIAGIVMLLVLRTEVVDATGRLLRDRPVAILVTGLLSLILIPAVILGLFISQVGWPVALALCLIASVVTVLSVAYTAISLGRAIMRRVNKWVTSLIFLVVFALLLSLPVVDFIVVVLCIVYSIGSAVQGWWVWRRGKSLAESPADDPDAQSFDVPRGVNFAEEQPAAPGRPLVPSNIAQNADTSFTLEPDEPKDRF